MLFKTQTEEEAFKAYVQVVAKATLEQGGTASKLNSYQFLAPSDLWAFPKYPGKTKILAPDVNLVVELEKFIHENTDFLQEPDCWLGTWINPQTGHIYLDISTGVEQIEDAVKMANNFSIKDGRRIVAIYNSKREQTIFLPD